MMTDDRTAQSISFLLAQICKAHRGCADEALGEIGLHVGQEMFLWHLWEQDGLTQSELAAQLCVQPPTVNKMLSRMESAGLLERRADMDDNRVSRVYLTEQSRSLQASVTQVWEKLEARTVANLSAEESAILSGLLLKVLENLKEET